MVAVIKKELISYFKNPTAYFLIAAYALFSSAIFSMVVLRAMTSYIGNYFGYWLFLAEMIMIAILSMKYFTEERKNKTDQLLLTSPVSVYGLVFGKFFGSMIIFLTASAVNIIYMVVIDMFGTLDYGALFTNIIGSLLICATMISVALFISSITESPLGSAAGTFAVFLIFFAAKFFAPFLPSFLKSVISYLSVFSYYDDFANGTISLTSVIYYLSMTAVFLFLTVRMVEKRRWS